MGQGTMSETNILEQTKLPAFLATPNFDTVLARTCH
jgi:hypothetical protein